MLWLTLKNLPVKGLGFRKTTGSMKLSRALKSFLRRRIKGTRLRNGFLILQGSAALPEFLAAAARAGIISSMVHEHII
ncbi:MAG: hypothetical protein A3K04_05235 [Gallionellales bacterium RBG_16_56_9]|nr:MAG: hypothetical protein A3K04_05235 [Gallionellales bacterium RBG_16_56_9]